MSYHIKNWHNSCSGFFQNWFIFSIYWILYLSIIARGSSSLEFNGSEVIFKLKGPETDILLGSWNKIENCLSTYFWDHQQNRVTYDSYWNHSLPHQNCDISIWHWAYWAWRHVLKYQSVFRLFWSDIALPHATPSGPNIPISTDLWPHFSYCATFHWHIVKFRFYGHT